MDSDLMALLVHDLKNPLAALLSNLGFIAMSVRDDEMTAEAVQDCLLSTEVLSRLVENLGAMGTLENGAPPAAESVLRDVMSSVEARMRPHVETSQCQLEMACASDVSLVAGNSKLLELALDNLIAASTAYAPSGATIRVEAQLEAGMVCVAVLDAGEPVIAEARHRIALKEAQVETKSAAGARYARGLGFYVVGLIAQGLGGELVIGERDGESCMELRLPVAE